MADTHPTKVTFRRACYLCLLCILCPTRLDKEQGRDNADRKNFAESHQSRSAASVVCRAFWLSFLLVAVSVVAGSCAGRLFAHWYPKDNARLVGILQIIGAFLLLWGTLFVRGWEIQTLGGVTLAERINQWLYRALYCIGTGLFVFSLTLS